MTSPRIWFVHRLAAALVAALVLTILIGSVHAAHASAPLISCSNGYTYRDNGTEYTSSLVYYSGNVTVTLQEKGFYFNHVWATCGEYHADATMCANAGSSIPAGYLGAWIQLASDQNGTHLGGHTLNAGALAGGTCETVSSIDVGFSTNNQINGYANYGKLVNGKPVYDPAGPFISKTIIVP